ncbi:hypothetical protein CPT03_03810 [Pedobacter ginsengisoli]|uniref:Uncharacterized protein n=1 Tax=Pedobacter ginsengisoli TaxID=363852 RepID=A0A2D1U204_9SPHI|nr:hypothetical protein [Pedobacter ginsengisoli]ATP55652.1 hypothetical protein CPT03_03810 [Pedobacter ginsengisoli]
MQRFLSQTFIFVMATVFILAGSTYITTFLIQKRNKEIHSLPPHKNYIIIGNSRPSLDFNDSLIRSAYNFSSFAESYFYTYLKAEQLIKANKNLKGVFLEYNIEDIGHKRDNWTWGKDLMQSNYIKYSYAMRTYNNEVLLKKNPGDLLAICFGRAFLRQLKNLTVLDSTALRKFYGGYFFDGSSIMDSTSKKIYVNQKFHLKNVSSFHKEQLLRLLDLFRDNNIKVYLIRSPLHFTNGVQFNRETLIGYLGEKNKDLDYLDFNDYPAKLDEFRDPWHLNSKGARKFSIFFNQLLEDGLLLKENKEQVVRDALAALKAQ